MRNYSGDSNHPMQPLSPKRQPWYITMTQTANRQKALANRTNLSKEVNGMKKYQTVQQELLLRERIEQRAMQKLEKLHEAVSVDRQTRRRQRQKSAGHAGDIVKALQQQEMLKRSPSVGSSPSSSS